MPSYLCEKSGLDQTIELRSPEDDALRRMVVNLVGVAQFSREARQRYSG